MQNFSHNVGQFEDFNETFNGTFSVVPELDLFFTPEPILIALYVPIILLSLIANTLLIVVAVKCNYTKK